MSGLNVDGHAFLSAQFERMSLIRPMMAIYLVEYEGRMKPAWKQSLCASKSPLPVKRSIATVTAAICTRSRTQTK